MRQPVGLGEAAGFLAERYAGQARDVAELGGGDWSRAFSFRLEGRDLVARFGRYGEDFARDQQAMALSGPDLPVPDVLETGSALGGAYAVSERRFGVFLETLDAARWRRLLPALLRALDALRDAPALDAGERAALALRAPQAAGGSSSWPELEDQPGQRVSGWRAVLARSAELDGLFTAGERAVSGLLDACPEIRHVLHRDLLNRNVLVAGDGSRLTAVFDWAATGWATSSTKSPGSRSGPPGTPGWPPPASGPRSCGTTRPPAWTCPGSASGCAATSCTSA